MNETEYQKWLEAAQSGQLSIGELQRLADQHGWPLEQTEELRREIVLHRVLSELPPIPVSSNFTYRVLAAVERETLTHRPAWREWLARCWPRWVAPAAAAAAVAIYLGVAQNHSANQRAQLAASVHAVAALVTAPANTTETLDLEVWDNFDVILRMGSVAPDNELLRIVNQTAKP